MEITALKTVLMVQAHGSIAGAARALDLDPSSVSRTVSAIEAELRIRLFHRTTRRLTVTEEGEVYLARLGPLIEEMDAAQEDARGRRGLPTGVLRMTSSVSFADHVIVPSLPAFHTRYPNISIDLQTSDTNLDLVENNIDLAVRLAPAPKGDLISTRLMQTHYRIVASPAYASNLNRSMDPCDLAELNCLRFGLPGLHNKWWFRKGKAAAFEVPVQGNLMISTALALRSAARAGMGVTMLADWLVLDDIKEGRLVVLFEDFECTMSSFETAAWALYPNRTYLPQKVRVMIDYLKSNIRGAAL